MFLENKDNLLIGRFAELFNDPQIFHGFSTRKGGVSSPPFEQLNLGTSTDDAPGYVCENRRRFFQALGVDSAHAAIPKQVHRDRIAVVSSPGAFADTDGLITDVPGVTLIVQLADCLPVFLYDPVRCVVGLVHAGWRGSAAGITAKAVTRMGDAFGSEPEHILAFLGPSIGPCCYEVGPEVIQCFEKQHDGPNRINLWQINVNQLIMQGLDKCRIHSAELCTACHPEWFFSHRISGGKTGRMMAVIGIDGKKAQK